MNDKHERKGSSRRENGPRLMLLGQRAIMVTGHPPQMIAFRGTPKDQDKKKKEG